MLAKFAVTNFRGFEKRIEWDLTKHRNFEFNSFAVKDGIVKNGIIYGPNGCGKSNFGLAIFDIVYHLTQKFKNPNYLNNYAFAGGVRKKLVKFEYTFVFDGHIVEYVYSKDPRATLREERLSADGKDVFARSASAFEIDTDLFPMTDSIRENLRRNANNISIVNFLLTTYPMEKDNYLIKMQNFVNSMLWFRCLEEREFIGLETNVYLLDEYIIRHDYVKEFGEFLEKVSGQHFVFMKPKPNDRVLFVSIDGVPQIFNVIASTGTHSLELLFFWFKHMEQASFVFIDEFDAFYHFRLAFDVCELLFKQKCQLFMSSHNTYLMTNDLLRPDCNFILNDNRITALCDATDKEIREGHNIEKLYRGGTFSI